MRSPWTLLVDFDGTLTEVDADIHIAKRMLDRKRYEDLTTLFHAYEAVEIGIADYFGAYIDMIDVHSTTFRSCLPEVPIRRDIVSLISAAARRVDVIIASEGLDVYIRPILSLLDLADTSLVCNRVQIHGGAPTIVPDPAAAPCDRCLSCKGTLVRRLKARTPSAKVALIGNGASDLCAAEQADMVFARDSLKRGCDRRGIAYTEWTTASDILGSPFWKALDEEGD